MHSDPRPYPAAERLDLVERLHGHEVADPYRWLEDPADERTVAWSAAQDELTREVLDENPGRDVLAAELTRLLATGYVAAPVWRAGRRFLTRREPDGEHGVLLVREPDDTERVLIDPMALDPSGKTTLDSWSPDLEGKRLAYQISVGGDEESQLYVLDIDSGELLEGPIDRCRYSPIGWLPGGEEFYYVRKLPADEVPEGEDQFHRRVWRHRIGSDDDVLVHGEGLDPTNYYGVHVSHDGRWLVIDASAGTARRDSVWIADLHSTGELRQILDHTAAVRAVVWLTRDGRLMILTTLDAPRWRLCVADPTDPMPERWTELVAEEPDSVLDGVRWLDDPDGEPLLVLSRTRHAVSELRLHSAADGSPRGAIELPGMASLTGLSTVDPLTSSGAGQVWIGWTDFVTPPGVALYSLATGRVEPLESAPGSVELPAATTRQLEYRSADGTTVRMFVLSATGEPDRPRPTVLTGYGGFALSREPAYTASALAWVAAGGVYVVASLRGGGEEGEEWHLAGMRESKHHVYEDFHAAADALVEQRWTTPEQLAIMGGSNGGLLVGAALTQRPDAYRAVVCSAPLLDMVRYERFLLGRTWNDEYGSADDPVELGWLLSYSPYHHIVDGTAYPAVLFTVFDSDTRVDPLHARKMCAALQAATTSDPAKSPVLLRRETDAGHGARSISRSVALAVDQLAFLADRTGLSWEG